MSDVDPEVQVEVVDQIRKIKEYVATQEGFHGDAWMRAIYVTLLTVEGAMMFDDIREFSVICVDYCDKKEKEMLESN